MHTPHWAHQHLANECILHNNIISYFICMNWCANVLISKLTICNQSSRSHSRLRPWLPVCFLALTTRCAVMGTQGERTWREKHENVYAIPIIHVDGFHISEYATRCVALFRCAQYSNRNNVDSVGVCAQFEHRFYDCNFTASTFPGCQAADSGSVCACVWLCVMHWGACYGIRDASHSSKWEWNEHNFILNVFRIQNSCEQCSASTADGCMPNDGTRNCAAKAISVRNRIQ